MSRVTLGHREKKKHGHSLNCVIYGLLFMSAERCEFGTNLRDKIEIFIMSSPSFSS